MTDNIEDIRSYYDKLECGEDSRMERHQLERDITLRYLKEYLRPPSDILEIGAATGAYTVWLAHNGHHVTAVGLSKSMIQRCSKRISKEGLDASVDCYVADSRNLSALPRKTYDAVLLMGPLYHLIHKEDRIRASGGL